LILLSSESVRRASTACQQLKFNMILLRTKAGFFNLHLNPDFQEVTGVENVHVIIS
jgi:hypothetical protein